ncbi:M28 family metallopeptidase [Terriglobus sp. 2YAB30_2]|uniref:M28 family metallopeptidase n=3 Tax=unclassified Terriglobus TaxID=2628988 RepID=UPI003F9D9511
MHRTQAVAVSLAFVSLAAVAQSPSVFGYRDFTQQQKWDTTFLAVPDPKLAGQHLKTLTAEPHWASSPEDLKTAQYVAAKFKEAGLQTEVVPYRVLLNKPKKISIEAFDSKGKKLMAGPTKEHVDGDPFQDDPRILPAFNGSSPSGDVTGEVIYCNYGTLADFRKIKELGIDMHGKIALVRYGQNFRGVKVYIAQQMGAAGVLIYSDPADDGWVKGDKYPQGAFRPDNAVQRGSVQFIAKYTGDPETPGVASTEKLPDSARLPENKLQDDQPSIPANPLSYQDALPILRALGGPESPRPWQGALPFTYHLGGKGVTAHMRLEQDYAVRTIWNVIGKIPGTDAPDEWVIAGNHRDAWVYGAVDPNSGTAAMLETVHGLGELLKQGWKPKRTVIIGSWDAEEEGLVGSTEWAEEHAAELQHAVAYFNTDVGVSGPDFGASSVPSLQQFVREVTKSVPSPKGGTVYDQWKKSQEEGRGRGTSTSASNVVTSVDNDVKVDALGSGSDYTPFIQHIGVPATDIGSSGRYGVYHSVFDNYAWFVKNADPTFVYEQQQARVFGLEILHMADADVLPYDYQAYGKAVEEYISTAKKKASTDGLTLNFDAAAVAAKRFETAGSAIRSRQNSVSGNPKALNDNLRAVEGAFISSQGLPNRPWYKHVIYAPGEYTGYAAVVIPGVNEAMEGGINNKPDAAVAQAQLGVLTEALNQAAQILEGAAH